jgi:antitoxin VapB
MNVAELFRVRIGLVQAFLWENGYDGVLLSRVDNFAMATGGKRNYVYTASDLGANSLFVGRDGDACFVGTNIEATRQMAEELGPLGCDVREFLWFDDTAADLVAREYSGTLVSDDGSLGKSVNGELAYLRALLTPPELEKYRLLGALAADAMTATVAAIEPGVTEADIAAQLEAEGARRRCQVPVALVAADERIAQFRHPLPTVAPLASGWLSERKVQGYVMVVGCFLREGLVVSLTRFKQVGEMPPEIPDAFERICGVDALMQEACEPGKTLGDVFGACQRAYAGLGFDKNEWHNHHQGGTTGYAGRTCKASPDETFPILASGWSLRVKDTTGIDVDFGHAFAWNPSAPGVKSEDTFILLPDRSKEIVTSTPMFPDIDLENVLGRPTDVSKSGIWQD